MSLLLREGDRVGVTRHKELKFQDQFLSLLKPSNTPKFTPERKEEKNKMWANPAPLPVLSLNEDREVTEPPFPSCAPSNFKNLGHKIGREGTPDFAG